MKVTYDLNLPDEDNEHRMILKSRDFFNCLFSIEQNLRSMIKFDIKKYNGNPIKDIEDLIEILRYEILQSGIGGFD